MDRLLVYCSLRMVVFAQHLDDDSLNIGIQIPVEIYLCVKQVIFSINDNNYNILTSYQTSSRDQSSPRSARILSGRSGILGDLCNSTFLDAACSSNPDEFGYVYFVTSNGLLCLFDKERTIDRWVDLQVCQYIIDMLNNGANKFIMDDDR